MPAPHRFADGPREQLRCDAPFGAVLNRKLFLAISSVYSPGLERFRTGWTAIARLHAGL